MLCHNCLESLVMQDKRLVDEAEVREVIAREVKPVLPEPAAGSGQVVAMPAHSDMRIVV
jgi:hypothetical protein